MTVAEMARIIGQTGTVRMDHSGRGECGTPGMVWQVPAVVLDVRQVWGRIQYQVRPVGFDGAPVWVERFTVSGVAS